MSFGRVYKGGIGVYLAAGCVRVMVVDLACISSNSGHGFLGHRRNNFQVKSIK